jgi:hypothetical protein
MTDLAALQQYGTDAEFRAFIQTLPSCLSGQFSKYVNGEGRNSACHVRRSATSGTGSKGKYCETPLLHEEHRTQHQLGELACLALHMGTLDLERLFAGTTDREAAPIAKRWFDEQVEKYREMWIKHMEDR